MGQHQRTGRLPETDADSVIASTIGFGKEPLLRRSSRMKLYNDWLPGVRSVIERTDIWGMVFSKSSEPANKAAQTMSVIKKLLRDIVTGNTGLNSAQTARNIAIHRGFLD
jgi:hypothetical protein